MAREGAGGKGRGPRKPRESSVFVLEKEALSIIRAAIDASKASPEAPPIFIVGIVEILKQRGYSIHRVALSKFLSNEAHVATLREMEFPPAMIKAAQKALEGVRAPDKGRKGKLRAEREWGTTSGSRKEFLDEQYPYGVSSPRLLKENPRFYRDLFQNKELGWLILPGEDTYDRTVKEQLPKGTQDVSSRRVSTAELPLPQKRYTEWPTIEFRYSLTIGGEYLSGPLSAKEYINAFRQGLLEFQQELRKKPEEYPSFQEAMELAKSSS